jgi:hypothetical protein
VLQTVLSSPYSVDAVRRLVAKCLDAIGSNDPSLVSVLKRSNASYLLVQLFESLWPRLRAGTFGVDEINVLCGFEASDRFFKFFFDSTLPHRDSDPVLVLLSLLLATRDVETNALADFFAERCKELPISDTRYPTSTFCCFQCFCNSTALLVRLFSISGQSINQSELNIVRSAQLCVCCRPQPIAFLRKAQSRPIGAKLGLFNSNDFETFVDALILCFF